jgi:hypothetical protein
VKLATVVEGLSAEAAESFGQWCRAEIAVRCERAEFAACAGQLGGRYESADRHELHGGPGDGEGELSALKVLIAAVWESAFDVWTGTYGPGTPVAARDAASQVQRSVLAETWVQLALLSGASAGAAAVVASLGPDWPEPGDGSAGGGWAGLLAAAEAVCR